MRRSLVVLLLLLGGMAWATPDAPGEFRLRLGPVFEWKSSQGELTRFAIRPFMAWEKSELHRGDVNLEVLWPISHFGWRDEANHWRVLLAFWNRSDSTLKRTRDYSFTLPPLWVHGRAQDEDYWGLFPVWGRMPRFFMVEDVRWGAFPLWLSYRTAGSQATRRDYFGWPFFSLKHAADRTRWALWPLYGTKRERGVDSRFVLWPLWNDRTFSAHNHNGTAWMLWPLMERIDTDTEQGFGLLPPFFRRSTTVDGATLTRCPWPLFERYTDPKESTWKSWRFWGMTTRGTRKGWWFLYPITVSQQQKTVNRYTRVFRVWPFYVSEETYGYDIHGQSHLQTEHFRVWPFFAFDYHEGEGVRKRSLVLFPIRDVPVIERNLAPFWTFYTATQKPGEDEVLHELFWGLIWWRTRPGDYAKRAVLEEEAP